MKNVKWLSLVLALVLCLFALPAQAETVEIPTVYASISEDMPSNDELFNEYALRKLYGMEDVSFFGVAARERLPELMKELYDALKPEIEKIAAGNRSATTFTFTPEQLGAMGFTVGGSFTTNEEFNAICDAFSTELDDFSLLLPALLRDCPYEMYWCDYTAESSIVVDGYFSGSEGIAKLNGNVVITLPVASAYSLNGSTTEVNTTMALAAAAAAAKAQDIVDAAQSMDDEAKLAYYAEQIMALVSYDHDAADNDTYNTDSNPWQLINVFDGNTSTNVVCEGYSKAFQYLCDLSTFDDAEVYTVSGDMAAPDESGVVGAGPHMWNIVSMGGKNYLVDVTNSEDGTVGMGGKLFMAKANKGGSVADGYVVAGYNDTPVTYKYDSDQKALWGEGVLKLAENVPVASITSGTTVTEYMDFADAVAAWTDGTTLTLLDNVSYDALINLGAGTRTFVGGKHTLDLGSAKIKNTDTLTITSGTITADNMAGGTIENWGELIINGNSVINNNENAAVVNFNKFEATGGTLTASTGLDNEDDGVAVLNGTTLSNVLTWGNVTLTNCTITLDNSSINHLDFRGGKVTINGDCAGWRVIYFGDNSAAVVGTDIVLPDNYYLFRNATIIPTLEYHEEATIGKHTSADHNYEYTPNDDGLTHNRTCTVGCGVGAEINKPHTAPNAEGKCVCGAQLVAEVGGTYYADFGKALAAWTDGTTLTLLDDVVYDSRISLDEGATRTFDGGSFTLTLGEWPLSNSGTLNITGGTISHSSNWVAIDNLGTLNITGGTVSAPAANARAITNGGSMTLDGGNVTGHSGIDNHGTVELKRGMVTAGEGYALYNSKKAILSGADLSTEGSMLAICCDNREGCEITISGGTIDGGDWDIERKGGKITITTTGCENWRVLNTAEGTAIGTDIVLPTDYYMFVDGSIVTEMKIGESGTIQKHGHVYNYTANDDEDIITCACTCGLDTVTAVLKAPADLLYNGEGHSATVETAAVNYRGTTTYAQNGKTCNVPVNVGTYTATLTWGDKSVSVDFTIEHKPLTATSVAAARSYNADTLVEAVPLTLTGVIGTDDVDAAADFQLASADAGEYTTATLKNEPVLSGTAAANYTLAPDAVTFTQITITKAAAGKWSLEVSGTQTALVGSGLGAIAMPTSGTGINGEKVDVASVTFYTDAAMQTVATDEAISSLAKGESITLYYKATADNYEAATGSMTVKAIAHQHEWTYTADEDTDTITAKCSGTIGTCPDAEQRVTLNAPDVTYSGNPVEAEVTCEGTSLTYTLQYSPNAPTNAGEYTVTMTVGDKSVNDTFTINPKDISKVASCQFSLTENSFVYSGEAPALNVTGVDSSVGNYTMQENADYTVGTVQVNAGSHKLTITGKGNYTGTVELDYEITRAPIAGAVITAESQVYTGEALEPAFTVELNGKALKHNVDFTFSWTNNVNVGKGKIVINGIGNYEGQAEGTFDITSAPADLTAETYLGESQTGDFTYGDVITIKGAVTVDRQNTFSLRRAPAANEVALYLEGGNDVIAGPVAADPATGEFTMTYDTTNKDIQIGQRNLKLVYVSDGNKDGTTGSVTVTLLKKELTIASAGAADREYEKDNKLVAVTGVDLDGIAAIGDDVKADLTGVQGTLASDNAGDYTTMVLPKLELTGSDKDYYTIAADEAVPTDVTITKAQLVSAELPTDVTLDTYLATADQVAAKLPATVVYTASNGDTVALEAAWTCADFDATPKAVNTFAWTVDASTLTNYELSSAVAATGTIKVTNTDALPVVITATDDSITFAEQPYGVAGMFAVDANAGDAHYEVVSGDAVLNGATLTVNKVGEIVIRLTTEANGAYAAAEATATLTVTKADPAVTAPSGLTATYGQTLASVELPAHDEGTWAWVDEAASVGDACVQTHEITFTPNDTTNWNTLTLDAQVNVAKANTEIALAVLNGETETSIFTYGETVTVKALPQRPAVLTLRRFAAPKANQMALFLGDEQISEAVDPDENGIYTMTIPTADKALKPGDNAVTIKYVGTDNMEDAQGVVTVTLLKKKLAIVNMAAKSRAYQPENRQVTVTAVELEGKLEGDDVAVGTLTARVSSANVGSYAAATLPQTVPLAGEDADYYEAEGDVEVPVPQKVNITQATPEPTGTGADAGQPAVTPVTEDGKTLADIPLSLPEDAYNVPGTIHWVDGDDTPVEEGKEYAWVFIPEDPNYAPVNGTVVIYPAGEAPVITAPTAAQTVTVVEGETGTMTVTATEAEKYQWYIDRNDGKGYVAMEGASAATYTTSKVNTDNDGFTYYCQVSNAYGESKSPVFTLKVKAEVDVPQTGDEAQLGLWLALMVLSLGGMAAMVMNCKRREN